MIKTCKGLLMGFLLLMLVACSGSPSASIRRVEQVGGQLHFELRVRDAQGRLDALEIQLVDDDDVIIKVLEDIDGLTEEGTWQVTMSIIDVPDGSYRLLVLGDYTFEGTRYDAHLLTSQAIEIDHEAALHRP